MPSLLVYEGDRRRLVEVPESGEFTIGRERGNSLQILEVKASRRHCQISHGDRGWQLIDLKSSNGTKLNGEQVFAHPLADQDQIVIGKTRLVFRLSGAGGELSRVSPPHQDSGGDAKAGRPADDLAPPMPADLEAFEGAETFIENAAHDATRPRQEVPKSEGPQAPLETPEKREKEGKTRKAKKKKRDKGDGKPAEAEHPQKKLRRTEKYPPPEPEDAKPAFAPPVLEPASAGERLANRSEPDLDALHADGARSRKSQVHYRADKRFSINEALGKGGMGAAYKVTDQTLMRQLAMKVMAGDGTNSAPRQQRFKAEAQITAQLDHPSIVPIHDLGVDHHGRPFFTMKLVRGRSLDAIIQGIDKGKKGFVERFPPRRLLNILVRVCEAVSFAHARGVIHRDLKTENIMVGDFGEVFVMDWGLAKVRGVDAKATDAQLIQTVAQSSRKSQEGMIAGTPAYMPPEQARGEVSKIDERSDVYALGGILYEILTRTAPYTDDDPQRVLLQVVEDPVEPPDTRRADLKPPVDLSAIAMKALAKDPADRYPTAKTFQADLERYLEGLPVEAYKRHPAVRAMKWLRRNWVIPAFTLAVVGTFAAVMIFFVFPWMMKQDAQKTQKAQAYLFQGRQKLADADDRAHDAVKVVRSGDFDQGYAKQNDALRLYRAAIEEFGKASAEETEHRKPAEQAMLEVERKMTEMNESYALELVTHGERLATQYMNMREAEVPAAWAEIQAAKRAVTGSEALDSAVKTRLRQAEDAYDALLEQMDQTFARAQQLFLRAQTLAPQHPEIRRGVANLYYRRFVAAEEEGEEGDARYFRSLVESYADETFAQRLQGDGALQLQSEPPGAQATLARLQERELRLQPTGESRLLGVTPLERTPLSMGSYLLTLHLDGYSEVVLPLHVTRTREIVLAQVRLFKHGEAPEGFVPVSRGGYRRESDYQASRTRFTTVEIDTFLMSRTETSIGEYLEFLNALQESDPNAATAQALLTATQFDGARWASLYPPDKPAFEVTAGNAQALARWKSDRARAAGKPWKFRLPTSDEWQKAARGTDGRRYPWGARFDFKFCNSRFSGASGPDLVAVDAAAFRATDVSPYGIWQMGGNVAEWTATEAGAATRYDEQSGREVAVMQYLIHGGSFTYQWPAEYEVANSITAFADTRLFNVGCRLVCEVLR